MPGRKRTELRATVSIRGSGGFLGRLAAKTAEGMLAAGALDAALYRIARAAESPFPAIAG